MQDIAHSLQDTVCKMSLWYNVVKYSIKSYDTTRYSIIPALCTHGIYISYTSEKAEYSNNMYRIHMHVYAYVYMYTEVYTYMHIYICMFTCVYLYTCLLTHIFWTLCCDIVDAHTLRFYGFGDDLSNVMKGFCRFCSANLQNTRGEISEVYSVVVKNPARPDPEAISGLC